MARIHARNHALPRTTCVVRMDQLVVDFKSIVEDWKSTAGVGGVPAG